MAQKFDHEDRRGKNAAPMVIELYRTAGHPALLSGVLDGVLGGRAGQDTVHARRKSDRIRWNSSHVRGDQGTVVDSTRSRHSRIERGLVAAIRHAQGLDLDERLARHPADSHLFTRLGQLDTAAVDDAALVEMAAAADRLEAAAHAMKLNAAAALAERESMKPTALSRHTRGASGVAGDELTLRLRISAKAGTDLVRRGTALSGHLQATGTSLARGEINAARAQVIVDGLEHVGWKVAAAVEAQVLPRAADRTPAQLRSDVAKALIAVDATEAEIRRRKRAGERRVSRPKVENDQMASMRLEGPAADVLALDLALDAAGRSAKAAGDERTMDQLRFDTLVGVGHHALTTGHFGDPATGTRLATTGGQLPRIHITVPLDQLLPRSAHPCPGRPGTDQPGSGKLKAGHPGTDQPGSGHSNSGQSDSGHPDAGYSDAGYSDSGQWDAEQRDVLSNGELVWPPTLTGESLAPDSVPELTGYGPITPAAARALAAGGVWSRIVTDPLSGAVLDVGTIRYRPTAAIAAHVIARDHTCVRPGCSHQARGCQLDHTHPYNHDDPAEGGPTSVANLGPLCGRDHQVKTHGNFAVSQPEPGVFEWITPTGHRYRRERDGTTTPLSHRPSDRPDAPPGGTSPPGDTEQEADQPPPF